MGFITIKSIAYAFGAQVETPKCSVIMPAMSLGGKSKRCACTWDCMRLDLRGFCVDQVGQGRVKEKARLSGPGEVSGCRG